MSARSGAGMRLQLVGERQCVLELGAIAARARPSEIEQRQSDLRQHPHATEIGAATWRASTRNACC